MHVEKEKREEIKNISMYTSIEEEEKKNCVFCA